jgi:mRNA interferase RelE/StbE
VKVEFQRSFEKDLGKILDPSLLRRIKTLIEEVESAEDLGAIIPLKKLQGYPSHYRLRVGDYRLGLIIVEDQVIFVRALHRKEIYRYFP